MNVTYTFTDHVAGEAVITALRVNSWDTEAEALSWYPKIEKQLADGEVYNAFSLAEQGENPDRVAVQLTQVDFDRRMLGLVMTLENSHTFLGSLPFWSAQQIRNGNNDNERATNLGVTADDYSLVATRFSQIQGIESLLNADALRVWDFPLEDWE